jgi:hypothetical protein
MQEIRRRGGILTGAWRMKDMCGVVDLAPKLSGQSTVYRHAWALRLRNLGFKGSISTTNLPEGKPPAS